MGSVKNRKSAALWALILLMSAASNITAKIFWSDTTLFLLGAWYFLRVFLQNGRRKISLSSVLLCVLAEFVMGVAVFYGDRFSPLFYGKGLVWIILFMLYFFLLFLALSCDASLFSLGEDTRQKPRPVDWLLLSAYLLLILAALYIKDFTNGNSPDVINQWDQIHGVISYNRIHAIGHTIFLKAILSLWDNYMGVIIVHMIGIVGLYVLYASWFCSKGISIRVIALVEGLSLIWTNSAARAYFFPWKDLPAAICVGIISYFFLRIQDKRKLSCLEAFSLGLALAWAALFRLNGIVAAGISGLIFLLILWKRSLFRQIGAGLAAVVLSVLFVKGCSDYVLKPVDMENGFAVQVFASGIASVASADQLLPEEEALVSEILSVDWMREQYKSWLDKRDLIWEKDRSERIAEDPNLEIFNNEFVLSLGENKKAVVFLYFKLLPHHLRLMLKDLIGSVKIVWAIDTASFTSNHVFFFMLLLTIAARVRLKIQNLLFFLPTVCNTVSIMISTITNEERYLLPCFLLLPFFFLYLLWRGRTDGLRENA